MDRKNEPHFGIRSREVLEQIEDKNLAPYAMRSRGASETRIFPEEEHPFRTAIQRDRDRIIHSRAFRRLKHKQQVFLTHEGDHYRTRLTHTLEVAQIARTMAKALGLNEELVEAIALGHDLGHTPFGHVGGCVLNNILLGEDSLDGLLSGRNLGGFKHNYQSLRVVDKLERKYEFDGLNLTSYVREGILKHTRLDRNRFEYPEFITEGIHYEHDFATTLEGQVVAICDEIAQRTHDLEDGIRAGYVELHQVRELTIVGKTEKKLDIEKWLHQDPYVYRNSLIKGLINLLVSDVITTTLSAIKEFCERKKRTCFFDELVVRFSQEIDPLQQELDEFIDREIIFYKGSEINNLEAQAIVRKLFKAYFMNPLKMPEYLLRRYFLGKQKGFAGQFRLDVETIRPHIKQMQCDGYFIRMISDHIAGMTDNFARTEFKKLKLTLIKS